MPKRVSYLTEDQLNERILSYQISSGQLNPETFDQLSPDQQQLVLELLFNEFTKNINVYAALSAVEFFMFAFTSLFFKAFPQPTNLPSGSVPLDVNAQALYNQLASLVEYYNFPLQSGTWQFSYLQEQVQMILNNREQYAQLKQNVTGLGL